MKLVFATSNKGKFITLQRELTPFGIELKQVPLNLPEPRSDDVDEIARAKAVSAWQQLQQPVLVMDAGFYIDSLHGFPKAFVNFTLQTIGLEGILNLVKGKNRQAEFRESLCYYDGTMSEPKCFTAHIRGTLTEAERGQLSERHWSPLALIFKLEGQKKTLAEMTAEEHEMWHKATKVKNPHAKDFPQWFLQHNHE